MSQRTFLALDLDEAIRRHLVRTQQELDRAGAMVRWTGQEQLHVTMKFLGDVPDEDVPGVCEMAREIAAGVEAFDFQVAGLSSSPPAGHMRMVWVGIQDPTGRMAELNDRLEEAAEVMGFKRENRRFNPHLTLGRVKSGERVPELRRAVAAVAETAFGTQGADELVVYSSQLTPDGPIYAAMARVPLAAGE
jgi:RNA 2',3'-cyclic 3'-phosphodiesterase